MIQSLRHIFSILNIGPNITIIVEFIQFYYEIPSRTIAASLCLLHLKRKIQNLLLILPMST